MAPADGTCRRSRQVQDAFSSNTHSHPTAFRAARCSSWPPVDTRVFPISMEHLSQKLSHQGWFLRGGLLRQLFQPFRALHPLSNNFDHLGLHAIAATLRERIAAHTTLGVAVGATLGKPSLSLHGKRALEHEVENILQFNPKSPDVHSNKVARLCIHNDTTSVVVSARDVHDSAAASGAL